MVCGTVAGFWCQRVMDDFVLGGGHPLQGPCSEVWCTMGMQPRKDYMMIHCPVEEFCSCSCSIGLIIITDSTVTRKCNEYIFVCLI